MHAAVAQLVEQWTENPRVGGSIPPGGIKKPSLSEGFFFVAYVTKQIKGQKKTVPWLGYPNKWNGLSVPGTVTGRVPAKSLFAFLAANLADLDFLFVDGGFVENLDTGFAAGRTSAVTVIDGGA